MILGGGGGGGPTQHQLPSGHTRIAIGTSPGERVYYEFGANLDEPLASEPSLAAAIAHAKTLDSSVPWAGSVAVMQAKDGYDLFRASAYSVVKSMAGPSSGFWSGLSYMLHTNAKPPTHFTGTTGLVALVEGDDVVTSIDTDQAFINTFQV